MEMMNDENALPRSTSYRCGICCTPAGKPHFAGCMMASVDAAAGLTADMLSELDISKLPLVVPAAIGILRTALSDQQLSAAARDVLAERRRQVEAEGMTHAGDDQYCAAELPRAAASYILNGANDQAPYIWPWANSWWKPRDARANYVRAAALLLAEIERIDRLDATRQPSFRDGGGA